MMIMVGFVGVANGVVVFQVKRMTISPALAYTYLSIYSGALTPVGINAGNTNSLNNFR